MDILISIVIPTYNCSQHISSAIDSVLAQTYRNIEVIVVDDGSIDDTKSILKRYGSKIKYVFQSNSGPSAARNKGIKLSSGEFIAFLDADDVWVPNKLELQTQLMEQYRDIGLVGCGYYNIDSRGKIVSGPFIPKSFKNNSELVREIMVRPVLNTPSVLVKKLCFEKVGLFDENLKGAEDWKMWIQIAKNFPIGFIEQPLLMIRMHGSNISDDVELMKSCALRVVRSDLYRGEHLLSMKAHSRVYTMAGIGYLEIGNRHLALANLLKAMVSYPLKYSDTDRKYRVFARCLIPPKVARFIRYGNLQNPSSD